VRGLRDGEAELAGEITNLILLVARHLGSVAKIPLGAISASPLKFCPSMKFGNSTRRQTLSCFADLPGRWFVELLI
jgi:hypothetical protein